MTTTTRFAPSPTGALHRGHAWSALFAAGLAQKDGGRFLLRMEDIDGIRCRREFEDGIIEDLHWLGLQWHGPVVRQSERMGLYAEAIESLQKQNLLYPCFCSRADIRREIEAAGAAPHDLPAHPHNHGQNDSCAPIKPGEASSGPLYPGTCRHLSKRQRAEQTALNRGFALRLDMQKAVAGLDSLYWVDRQRGRQQARPELFGDIVLARKDVPASYHLSVTLDDHLQGVTLVSRGEDLFPATHIHRLLQALLGLDVPDYHHHPLLTDETGRRYAKRDRPMTLEDIRAGGTGARELRRQLGFSV